MSKEILFIETNFAGNGVMSMRAAKNLGYRCHFVTSSIEQYAAMADHPSGVADEVSIVDTYDITKLLHFGFGRRPAAVMAFDDFRVLQAAILADHLGVPSGPSYHALANVRFKDRMRRCLERTRHHVRHSIHRLDDLDGVVKTDVGFPCVVKPVDGSGSVGVRICDNDAELQEAIAYAVAQRGKIRVGGYKIDHLIIEEVIEGEEYSAEMVWDAGISDWRLVGVTKTYLSELPHRVELGHLFPFPLAPQLVEHITAELRDVLAVLGLTQTIVHMEFRLKDSEVKVVEVNPRPAGGRITQVTQAAQGIDLTLLHLSAQLGQPLPEQLGNGSDQYAAVGFFVPDQPGSITGIVLPPATDPRILATGASRTPLEVRTVHDNDARIAWAVAVGDSVAEVEGVLAAYVDTIEDQR